MARYEGLREIVRASGLDQRALAVRAAELLGSFGGDPAGLVTACRQIVAHHQSNPYAWWLATQVLAAPDGAAAALTAAGTLEADRTGAQLVAALPFPTDAPVVALGRRVDIDDALESRFDLEVVDDERVSRDAALAARVAYALVVPEVVTVDTIVTTAAVTDVLGALPATTRTWVVVPAGRALPRPLFHALSTATTDQLRREVDRNAVDRLITGRGRLRVGDLSRLVDVPVAPELLRPL